MELLTLYRQCEISHCVLVHALGTLGKSQKRLLHVQESMDISLMSWFVPQMCHKDGLHLTCAVRYCVC